MLLLSSFLLLIVLYLAWLVIRMSWAVGYARRRGALVDDLTEPVDVMQPILGGDPDLEEALRDNLLHTDARVRFLWLVDEDDHLARQVVRRLGLQYPTRIKIIPCAPFSGQGNPKVAKLIVGLEHVSAPWVAVLDDDTRLSRGQLADAVEQLSAGATLYTGLPSYVPAPNIPSRLVANFVNISSALTYLAPLRLMRPVTLNGMFYVVSADWLRESRVMELIVGELCDDYALAKWIRSHGGSIHQGVMAHRIRTTVHSFRHYASLMHRWMLFADLLFRDLKLGQRILVVALLGVPPLLLWSWLVVAICVAVRQPGLALAVVGTGLLLRDLALRLGNRWVGLTTARVDFHYALLAELLMPLHVLHALVGRTIQWRSRRFRVSYSGRFQTLQTSAKPGRPAGSDS